MRTEDSRRTQNLVKVLELLTRPLLVGISDRLFVDLYDVREPVDDEGPEQHSTRDFVAFNRNADKRGQCL